MEKICPYCRHELIEGFINGGKFSFKWYKKDGNFLEKYTVFGGEHISDNPYVSCYRCKECNKIIINIDELK